ncbi:MAG: hypothetical protein ACP5HM_14925 [Anaerolineae bacterium]
MDFAEAERRFQWLEQQRAAGALSPDQYRAEVHKLRVTDAQGRVWMPQERTGQWYVYQNGQWLVAQPPRSAPSAPPPPPPMAYAPQQPALQAAAEKRGGCGKTLLYLFLWAVIWTVIAVVVYLIWGREEPMVLGGVALAAVISLIAMLVNLSSRWAGQIVDIRMEQVRTTDEDGYTQTKNVRYAYIRRDNGKTKKMQAPRKWQVGDRLEKRRGEGQIRHYPRA